jgi:hypothetical protein
MGWESKGPQSRGRAGLASGLLPVSVAFICALLELQLRGGGGWVLCVFFERPDLIAERSC